MRDDAFPDAVIDAMGSCVPCLGLFSGIKLLQIIEKGDVRPRGSCVERCMRHSLFCYVWPPESNVLLSPGYTADTLMTRTDHDDIKKELVRMVKDEKGQHMIA